MTLGFWRFLLAILVVFAHLYPAKFSGVGGFAVFSFYILSGYLITRVIDHRYSNGLDGVRRFTINRFLRLYPTYYAVLAVSLLAVLYFPDVARKLNPAMALPHGWYSAISQLTIFGLLKPDAIFTLNPSSLYYVRMVPVAWSLNMELIFYALLVLALGRNRLYASLWWITSIFVLLSLFVINDERVTYFTVLGPGICFSTGAMLHYYRHLIPGNNKYFTIFFPMGIFLAFVLVFGTTDIFPEKSSKFMLEVNSLLLLSIFLSTCCLITLISVERIRLGAVWRRIDSLLADLAYPVFLSHWLIAILVAKYMAIDTELFTSNFLMLCLTPIVVFSLLIVFLIDRPVQSVRTRFRNP